MFSPQVNSPQQPPQKMPIVNAQKISHVSMMVKVTTPAMLRWMFMGLNIAQSAPLIFHAQKSPPHQPQQKPLLLPLL
jgi:hypothetical protein